MDRSAMTESIRVHKRQLADYGFTPELWSPPGGHWSPSEREAREMPHEPQLFAALIMFHYLFVSPLRRVWVHLCASMQAGKTGAVTALIRIIYANISRLNIPPHKVFMLTGMSDNAWVKQTKERLPILFRPNVYHNGGVDKVMKAFNRMHNDDDLNNLIIFVDESQIASGGSNRMSKNVYAHLRSLCPVSEWAARGIRFVTISATDPAKVMEMENTLAVTVRLLTTEQYQSVEKLNDQNRVRYLEDVGEVHTDSGMLSLLEDVASFNEPRYHIIRPRPKQHEAVVNRLRELPGVAVVQWDAKRKQAPENDEASTTISAMDDINELLATEPDTTTFIVLKNMFYASKTMDDSYVGVGYDRLAVKDETNLQGLLGRMCGYGKRTDTIVYTSKETINRWIECWKELCGNDEMSLVIEGGEAMKLDLKMTNVRAFIGENGTAILSTTRAAACPVGVGLAYNQEAAAAAAARRAVDDTDFESVWQEFPTLEAAKVWGKHIHTPKTDANGFELTSTTGKATILLKRDVDVMRGGKPTAAMPTDHKKKGDQRFRLFVQYQSNTNPATKTYIVHRLTRITDV